jgi:hypothetical protein
MTHAPSHKGHIPAKHHKHELSPTFLQPPKIVATDLSLAYHLVNIFFSFYPSRYFSINIHVLSFFLNRGQFRANII